MIDNEAKARWAAWQVSQQPARPRLREYLWMAVVAVLAVALLTGIIERAAPQEKAVVSGNAANGVPPAAAAASARLAEVVTACLSGPHFIKDGNETVAKCEPVRKRK